MPAAQNTRSGRRDLNIKFKIEILAYQICDWVLLWFNWKSFDLQTCSFLLIILVKWIIQISLLYMCIITVEYAKKKKLDFLLHSSCINETIGLTWIGITGLSKKKKVNYKFKFLCIKMTYPWSVHWSRLCHK